MIQMNKSTLVLNRNWEAIEKVGWQRAFTLIYQEKARAIEYYDDIIHSPTDEFFIPSVIVLTEYAGYPKRRLTYSKRLVIERDDYVCQYCRRQLTSTSATIDHVLPRAQGGKSTFENTVAACSPCNMRKANRTPRQAHMKLIKQPKKPYVHPLQGKIGNPDPTWINYLDKRLRRFQ